VHVPIRCSPDPAPNTTDSILVHWKKQQGPNTATDGGTTMARSPDSMNAASAMSLNCEPPSNTIDSSNKRQLKQPRNRQPDHGTSRKRHFPDFAEVRVGLERHEMERLASIETPVAQ
jgi:hypothetical protein